MKSTPKPRTVSLLKITGMILALLFIAAVIIFSIWRAGFVSWTGFGDFTTPTGEFIRGKTLWDWMELLVIPITLLIGGFILNSSERAIERQTANERAELERELAKDRQQEAALQAYLDRMSELLLKEKLRTTKKSEVRNVARIRTLSIIRVLDTQRKDIVIQFLRNAQLITDTNSLWNGENLAEINLQDINLSLVYMQDANLGGAIFRGASLVGAHLDGANLSGADFEGANCDAASFGEEANLAYMNLKNASFDSVNFKKANFEDSNLEGANFYEANLEGAFFGGGEAILSGVKFTGANLKGAYFGDRQLKGVTFLESDLRGATFEDSNLEGADFWGADLRGATVTNEQLAQAQYLRDAIMPDGTKHE